MSATALTEVEEVKEENCMHIIITVKKDRKLLSQNLEK